MRHSWLADIQSGFDVVNFCIPQSALEEIARDHGSTLIDELHCPMSEAKIDTVAINLALAFIPALMRPNQTNRLFIDHAWRAVTAHLARTYGSHGHRWSSDQGGLAPWQERRAKEMLMADLSGSLESRGSVECMSLVVQSFQSSVSPDCRVPAASMAVDAAG